MATPEAALAADSPPAEWIGLAEAESITGIRRDALYQRIKSGSIPAENVRKTGDQPRAPYEVKRSVMMELTPDSPKAARKPYTRKAVQPGATQMVQSTPNNELSNHVSFAAGHCQAWLEVYAQGNELVAKQLIGAVTDVLKRGAK